jgi:hypothetical protein
MPMIEPEYEENKDAHQMITKLCDLYPEKLGHIDPNLVFVCAITNKDKPEGQNVDSTIVGIKPPISLCCDKKYVIWFYKQIWDSKDVAQQALMLMAKLLRIDEMCDGKIISEDLKDVKCLVKAFGVDYTNNAAIPNIIDVKQIF